MVEFGGPKFRLPKTDMQEIPVRKGRQHLNFSFIEVGCSPANKRVQLRGKRSNFHDYWRADIVNGKVDWQPVIRRTLIHFNHRREFYSEYKQFLSACPDVEICYQNPPSTAFDLFTEQQRNDVLKRVRGEYKLTLTEILDGGNLSRLHDYIINCSGNATSSARGRLAEIVALNDIEYRMPGGVKLLRNSQLNFNAALGNNTEIDGILTHYGTAPYWELIENMRCSLYADVWIDGHVGR